MKIFTVWSADVLLVHHKLLEARLVDKPNFSSLLGGPVLMTHGKLPRLVFIAGVSLDFLADLYDFGLNS